MKQLLYKIFISLITCTIVTGILAQGKDDAPKPKPADPRPNVIKPKPAKKKVMKEEDDEKPNISVIKKPTAFAYLIVKSNKGSGITYEFTGDTISNPRRLAKNSASKKYPLDLGDDFVVYMKDGAGIINEQQIYITDENNGQTIIVAFPEINYDSIKQERLRELNEEARNKQLQNEAILEEIRDRIVKQANECGYAFNDIEAKVEAIKYGRDNYDETLDEIYNKFLSHRAEYANLKKEYSDSATSFKLKNKNDELLKEFKIQEEGFQDKFSAYILGVRAGKLPMSANAEVAFKYARTADLKFFIPKDSIDIKRFDGELPLFYALKLDCDTSVFSTLINSGATLNYYGSRYPGTNFYKTPLSEACAKGNMEIIKLFIADSARFYPKGYLKKQKEEMMKYFQKTLKFSEDVITLMKESGYDMDDGIEMKIKAINQIVSEMILVPGGTFVMGCSLDNPYSNCPSPSRPFFNAAVDSFSIGKYEITQQIWQDVMEENPSYYEKCKMCPVELVSWEMIDAFIQKINKINETYKLTEGTFRLPTEMEWEYAARGGSEGSKQNYLFAGSNNLDSVGWFNGNSKETQKVGQKMPNQLGIYDMCGNVAEWCSDWYAEDYYKTLKQDTIHMNLKGPANGVDKVVRGGSFLRGEPSARVFSRPKDGDRGVKASDPFTGFRLVLEFPKKTNEIN